ncbi:hypothetical protein BKK47_00315 [Rodentibacter mrazii]|uniref:Alpha/beta hydrolase n=1 Tax=Rodentibacter mrazii TaxID=1908257 RepID=A0A1V3IKB8_9PAST|nr:alpha/beta hydrolase [Rodentibacter mrazii]OOF41736.1 hypothetical protein BKK47_00315 [Rodentibacter mrazii]
MIASHQPEQIDSPTNMCRTNVTIYHCDTLNKYRKLPDGIVVTVFDSSGKAYPAKIKSGESEHNGVLCGEISWQLSGGEAVSSTYTKKDNRRLTEQSEHTPFKASDGYVLIKARNQSDDEFTTSKEPLKQLADPLKVQVSFTENKVEAVYLPPPILVNLRLRQNETTYLNERQIQQIIDDGGYATLFIHGYSVPLGHMGRFATDEELGEQVQYRYRLNSEDIQRPFLHQHEKLMKRLSDVISEKQGEVIGTINGEPYAINLKKFQQRPVYAKYYLTNRYEKLEDTYNGFKALAWIPNVEYYLNLAASGKDELSDFDQWENYSRIVGVTWSGSVDPDMNFFRAEMYANESGRRLAGVLKQLIDKGIRINIITHSLGARVALSAMNVLGDFDGEYDDKIDNLIMWEAAVADNAITNFENYEKKKTYNPVAMEIFPYAYKVPKHITVLYSQEDGVLDKDKKNADDEFLGILGGAYPKKYWSIGGPKWAFEDYYQGTEIGQFCESIHNTVLFDNPYDLHRKLPKSVANCRYRIRELLEQEAQQVAAHGEIAELNYLKPWSHFRRFPKEVLEHIIEVLTDNVVSNWQGKGSKVRAALGHQGERQTVNGEFTTRFGLVEMSETNKKEFMDKFIKDLFKKAKKLDYFGQWEDREDGRFYYFISHSAMREWEWKDIDVHLVFPLVYKYSYREWIMKRKIQEHSKFGRY